MSTSQDQLSLLKRAYLKLEELQGKLDAAERATREPVAVVGIGCRFPGGADTPDAFWRILRAGIDTVRPTPNDRWDVDASFDPTPGVPGKTYSSAGAYLDRVDRFEPQFFGISPREAVGMDPQQRLLLEVSWEALEHAGIAPDRLSGSRTGVFVGICTSDYSHLQIKAGDPTRFDAYYGSGIAHSVASGRLSYVLGLQGPSVSIDTACSSSLVALHLATRSLRSGECRLALVGGVNLILSPENSITFSKSSMLARDGRCKTFSAAADGFGEGEGCAVLVLKRLSDAVADGDRVLAVVRGSAVNQDGPSSGLTAPNGPSQVAVIREALADGGVAPVQVSYVEAHGTGTSLGDPIEVQALGTALGEGRPADAPLLIGSVKTNVSHLEAAAGLAGVVKVVLALQHREIPPHLHFETPNPHIPWGELPVEVVTDLREWRPPAGGSRIAGVSAFGFSGTNAHVVLEEAPPAAAAAAERERPLHVLPLSARSDTALQEMARRYRDALERSAGLSVPVDASPARLFADACFTAGVGRARLSHRLAIVSATASEAIREVDAWLRGSPTKRIASGVTGGVERPRIAFLFTGQGAQYAQMGRRLYETQPAFQRALDRCDAAVAGGLERRLSSVMFAEPGSAEAGLLDETAYTQPALFAIEYALAELWRSWGITPSVVLGHSVGEYAAACVAGAMTVEDAIGLIAERGRLMQALPRGGQMAAVFAGEATVSAALASDAAGVAIAALNGPENTVISGAGAAVEAMCARFAAAGIGSKRLSVSHAFHSPLMDPMLDAFERAAARVTFARPDIVLISNVTGREAEPQQLASAAYWRAHVRQTVRFADSIAALDRLGCDIAVEIGPQPTLIGMAKACGAARRPWLPSLRRGHDDWAQILESLAELFVRGADVDWAGFDAGYGRSRISLPTYPFERERYWIAPATARIESAGVHPLLGARTSLATGDVVYETSLDAGRVPFLADHVVHGVPLLPTTAYLEMASAVARDVLGASACAVRDLSILEPLLVPFESTTEAQVLFAPGQNGAGTFRVFSRPGGVTGEAAVAAWTLHASGTIAAGDPSAASPQAPDAGTSAVDEAVEVDAFYGGLHARGLAFGTGFKGVRRIRRRDGRAAGEVELPDGYPDANAYAIHPALLDACLQVLAAAMPGFDPADGAASVYMPIALDAFDLFAPAGSKLRCVAAIDPARSAERETLTAHLEVADETGQPVARLRGLHLKRAERRAVDKRATEQAESWLYRVEWRPQTAEELQPSVSATPAAIAAGIAPRASELAALYGASIYERLNRDLDRLCVAYIVRTLERLGCELTPSDRIESESLAERLGVVARHRRLFTRLLEILAEEGMLRRDGQAWTVVRRPDAGDPARLADALLAEWSNQDAELSITRRCGEQLAEALRGEADPLQLLFPGGDIEGTARIYDASPMALTYNSLVREAVAAAVARRPEDRRVRVLEIGAGTGGTTQFVLDSLPAAACEYVYTDIGQAFLSRAARRFAAYPFVRYKPLDIDRDPIAQGFEPHGFDLILAANVLHATLDLGHTLDRVRRLLAPGGLLLLLEGTRPQRWFDLTFGLTEGWWRFEDAERRANYPLLDRAGWRAALSEAGLVDATAVPDEDAGTALTQNAVLLATAPPTTSDGAIGSPGTWLVFADRSGIGDALASRIERGGHRCVRVTPGERYAWVGDRSFTIDPLNPQHYHDAWRDGLAGSALPCRGAVHLWALDATGDDEPSAASVSDAQRLGARSVLSAAQALVAAGAGRALDLCLVTRGAQPVGAGPRPGAVAHAPIWGMAKAIALEHPDLRCVRLDLDPDASDEDAARVFAELRASGAEDQVAWRGGLRHVARLVKKPLDRSLAASSVGEAPGAVRVEIVTPGTPDGVALVPSERRRPAAGEVEIRVRAAALNFRDVLNVLGVRGDVDPLGGECAGTVVRVGKGVDALRPGDEVVAVAAGCFGSYVTVPTSLLFPKPATLSFPEAASAPLAFLTAWYALHGVGRLQPGERVLIHAAAGGVGLAAVQIAQRAGAEVFATAGSASKRAFLASIGVRYVADSRSLDFARLVREWTDGGGLDVVLNSLTGESIDAGLALLREGGRFLEIGKSDLRTPSQVERVNRAATYVAVDLAGLLQREPARMRPLIEELLARLERRELRPLPVARFELSDAAGAFRHMARARHIGKVVLLPEGATEGPAATTFRPDATYLITGGLGGLGLEVARWMASRGARHLALAGRRDPSTAARETIETLRRDGVDVAVLRADVADGEQVRTALATIAASMPVLRGVVHSAGVLDDGVVMHQDWDRFARVLAPKVDGSWHLHVLTRTLPLDFFVLFSSASALLGSTGQSNHAAANAFLDALAHLRRAEGRPATSINWGAWTEIGAAARHGVERRIAARGVGAFTPEQGLHLLDRALASGDCQVAVLPVDWPAFAGQFRAERTPGFFAEVLRDAATTVRRAGRAPSSAGRAPTIDIRQHLRDAADHKRRPLLAGHVEALAVRVLGLPEGKPVDRRLPLSEMGLDSLMAVELRNALGTSLGLALPATLLFDYPSIDGLGDYLFGALGFDGTDAGAPAIEEPPSADVLDLVESLSDEDVERMFSQRGVHE